MKVYKLLFLLTIIGLGLSTFLWYQYSLPSPVICLAIDSCQTVKDSEYSTILGIKLPVWGFMFFIISAIYLGLSLFKNKRLVSDLIVLMVLLGAALFESYLVYVQIYKIEALCSWCLLVSFVVVAMFVLFMVDYGSSRKKITTIQDSGIPSESQVD